MKIFYQISTYLLFSLGLVHIAFTPVFYQDVSLDALWYAGAGLSLLFLAILNLIALKSFDHFIFRLTLSANVIELFYWRVL